MDMKGDDSSRQQLGEAVVRLLVAKDVISREEITMALEVNHWACVCMVLRMHGPVPELVYHCIGRNTHAQYMNGRGSLIPGDGQEGGAAWRREACCPGLD